MPNSLTVFCLLTNAMFTCFQNNDPSIAFRRDVPGYKKVLGEFLL